MEINLSNWYSYTFTWQNGRELASAVKGGVTTTYKYGADGMRVQKKVENDIYFYYYSEGLLMRQTWGANYIDFLYDESGLPYSFIYNGTRYYYVKNLQNDVIAIANTSGSIVVNYTYDAWGNILSTTGSLASTVGAVNPIRYRSYYYDIDTGFYYLQTRYYDPAIRRFINADGYINANGDFIGFNMYAYCGNNPVMNVDYTGEGIGAVIFGLVILASVIFTNTSSSDSSQAYQDLANNKYNSNTININNNNENGILNVNIKNGDTIEIYDSVNITSRYEKQAILETVFASSQYTGKDLDIDEVIIEWTGHNIMYDLCEIKWVEYFIENVMKEKNASVRFKDVSIQGEDLYQDFYRWITLGGIIS